MPFARIELFGGDMYKRRIHLGVAVRSARSDRGARQLGLLIVAVAGAAALAGCGKSADTPQSSDSEAPAQASAPETTAETAPAPASSTHEDIEAALAALPAPYNTANLKNGKAKFAFCQTCHTTTEGGPNITGPNLHGVFGRAAASLPGFSYSDALKGTGWTWDAQHVDTWVADPKAALPGTKMIFAGIKKPEDREDLIAYLMVKTGYKP